MQNMRKLLLIIEDKMQNIRELLLIIIEDKMQNMRKLLLIISTVLFLISLVGTVAVFSQPIELEEKRPVLNYEHKGRFDYDGRLKASYLFDDLPLETSPETNEITEIPEAPEVPESPPSVPQYPIEITDQFDMIFTYAFVPDTYRLITSISAQVEVKAVLKEPGEEPKEIVLVDSTNQSESLKVNFSLDASELALSPTTTITANVYTTMETMNTGPIFESFTQSFTIRSKGPLLEMDKNLVSTQRASFGELSYEQTGEFDYSVRLKSDSPWGAITIRRPPSPPPPPPPLPPPPLPPPPPPPLSSKILEPGETIFPKLIEKIDVTFYYALESDKPLDQVATEVEIVAVLQATDLWSKKFPLLHAEKGGNFNVSFPLDLIQYEKSLETIRDETGASAESYSLAIIADVHTVAETQFGRIDEVFSQTLSTMLEGGTLEWNEELIKTQTSSIKETRLIPNPNKYLGLSLSGARNLSAAAMGIFPLFFVLSVVLYIWFKPLEPSPVEKEVLLVRKRYGERMIETTSHMPTKGERITSLSSMEDLLKIADEISKPIIHEAPGTPDEPHAYYVFDGGIRYQYLLDVSKKEHGNNV